MRLGRRRRREPGRPQSVILSEVSGSVFLLGLQDVAGCEEARWLPQGSRRILCREPPMKKEEISLRPRRLCAVMKLQGYYGRENFHKDGCEEVMFSQGPGG